MLAEVLKEEGYEVNVAISGKQALDQWEKHPFDAVLLDAWMPDVSGWELARELRKRSKEVLLGMVTGLEVAGQSRSTLSLVDAVFHKPVKVDAVADFLAQPT
jgi:DNA-binding response OmpR family regulator